MYFTYHMDCTVTVVGCFLFLCFVCLFVCCCCRFLFRFVLLLLFSVYSLLFWSAAYVFVV